MEKVKLNDLIKFEEVLLRIRRRHDMNTFTLPFEILVKLENELNEISKISNLYFSEVNRLNNGDENEMKNINNVLLNSEIEYDLTNYKNILTCEIVSNFYSSK